MLIDNRHCCEICKKPIEVGDEALVQWKAKITDSTNGLTADGVVVNVLTTQISLEELKTNCQSLHVRCLD